MGPRFIVEERVRVGYVHVSIGEGSIILDLYPCSKLNWRLRYAPDKRLPRIS